MNVNRQNNRCVVTPPMPPCGNRPIGRPIQRPGGTIPMPCPEICTPCSNITTICQDGCNVCVEECNVCDNVCDSCSDNNTTIGGVIFGSRNACNKETSLQGLALAMAYVPWQPYENLYPISQALRCGTLFRDLDFDFKGRRCN